MTADEAAAVFQMFARPTLDVAEFARLIFAGEPWTAATLQAAIAERDELVRADERLRGDRPMTEQPPALSVEGAREWAKRFHEAYERLAPEHSYETRKESAVPWEQVPEQNRSLMVAVMAELLPAVERRVLAACWRCGSPSDDHPTEMDYYEFENKHAYESRAAALARLPLVEAESAAARDQASTWMQWAERLEAALRRITKCTDVYGTPLGDVMRTLAREALGEDGKPDGD